jgi:hypothetical protein
MKLFRPNQHDGDGPKTTCLRHGLQALKCRRLGTIKAKERCREAFRGFYSSKSSCASPSVKAANETRKQILQIEMLACWLITAFANRSRILPSRWDRTQFVAAILACGQHYGKDGGGLL